MKKVAIIVGASVILLFTLVAIISFIPRLKVTRHDSVSGLSYQIPIYLLRNKDFSLIVKKQTVADLQKLDVIDSERTRSSLYPTQSQLNEEGILYKYYPYEECYSANVFTESLDPNANKGKKQVSCSDAYGLEQDRYYVNVDDAVYLFTTEFPTRVVFHDFSFGEPSRISINDFKNIIDSLRK